MAATLRGEGWTGNGSLGLLADVQQHADAGQHHEQARSAIGDERQRDAFGRQQRQDHADVEESLDDDHGGDAHGKVAAKGIERAQ